MSSLEETISNLLDTPQREHQLKETLQEAMKRYPHAVDGLIWFSQAAGLSYGKVTDEDMNWADSVINKKEKS